MNKRTTLLAAAGVLAAGAGLLMFNYIENATKSAQSAPPRSVLVAAQDIAPHAAITADMVKVVNRPSDMVDPDAMASLSDANGETAQVAIPAGSTITSANVSRVDAAPAAVRIEPGKRAMSIPVDDVKDVSGLVQVGDHVDVIAVPPRVGDANPGAYTILRNIRVLAVGGIARIAAPASSTGSDPNAASTPSPEVRTVTLEVSPDQANLLALADINTTLRLSLRAPHDVLQMQPEQLAFPAAPIAAAAPASAPAQRAADPPPRARAQRGVTVINGDQVGGTGDSTASGGDR